MALQQPAGGGGCARRAPHWGRQCMPAAERAQMPGAAAAASGAAAAAEAVSKDPGSDARVAWHLQQAEQMQVYQSVPQPYPGSRPRHPAEGAGRPAAAPGATPTSPEGGGVGVCDPQQRQGGIHRRCHHEQQGAGGSSAPPPSAPGPLSGAPCLLPRVFCLCPPRCPAATPTAIPPPPSAAAAAAAAAAEIQPWHPPLPQLLPLWQVPRAPPTS